MLFDYWPVGLILLYIISGIRVLNQYENGVVFTLGKYTGTYQPGFKIIFPIIQRMVRIDLRIRTLDIDKQQVMTKDNVPIMVNGVVYYKVQKPDWAVIKVEDFIYAISQYAQTALRDIIGQEELDTVLTQRERIGNQIQKIVDKETDQWGLDIQSIKLQDVEVPDDLKRLMSRQAAAEREKRATVIKAEGDRMAAKNLAEAARVMHTEPGAMQLRTLQTLDGLGPTASNTVILGIPVELMEMVNALKGKLKKG
ncbi:MAG: slipin family protein [Nanoarchaeota archaeon]|nr:slipin family protein [Nanoarchaeota archaeon]